MRVSEACKTTNAKTHSTHLILLLHLAIHALPPPIVLDRVQYVRVGMMTEHVLHLPREGARPDHVHGPTGDLVRELRGSERAVIAVVLDVHAYEGGEYAHGDRPRGGHEEMIAAARVRHLEQTVPESQQEQRGLDSYLDRSATVQSSFRESIDDAPFERRVEIGIPGIKAAVEGPGLHGPDAEFFDQSSGHASGVIRLEQHRRVLARSEEYQVATWMNGREPGDVEDDVPTITVIIPLLLILRVIVVSSSSPHFAAAATTTATPPPPSTGGGADGAPRRGGGVAHRQFGSGDDPRRLRRRRRRVLFRGGCGRIIGAEARRRRIVGTGVSGFAHG